MRTCAFLLLGENWPFHVIVVETDIGKHHWAEHILPVTKCVTGSGSLWFNTLIQHPLCGCVSPHSKSLPRSLYMMDLSFQLPVHMLTFLSHSSCLSMYKIPYGQTVREWKEWKKAHEQTQLKSPVKGHVKRKMCWDVWLCSNKPRSV